MAKYNQLTPLPLTELRDHAIWY